MTGLPSRRAMGAALEEAMAAADGKPGLVCVALLDIDHFKHINDFQGHATGDWVLAELGVLLRSHFAGRGMAARYGGEEFVAVIPATNLRTAELQCDFLCLGGGRPAARFPGDAQHRRRPAPSW